MASSKLELIAKQAFKTFCALQTREFPSCLSLLKDLMNTVTIDDIPFDRDILLDQATFDPFQHEAPVGYVQLCEISDVMSMGIFILRKGTHIPLHDHPGMYGLLKAIYGCGQIQMFSKIDGQVSQAVMNSLKPWQTAIAVKQEPLITCTQNDPVCELTPTVCNIHEVQSVSGPFAFLDILAPPYDEGQPNPDRPCNYYRVLPGNESVVTIPESRDFCCQAVKYRGPKLVPFD